MLWPMTAPSNDSSTRSPTCPASGRKARNASPSNLLNAPDEESQALIDAITEVKEKVRFCDICGNVCETSPCPVCVDPRRDHSVICVVEEPKDVMSIERTREYRGMYHVLGGVINPMATCSQATSTSPNSSNGSKTAKSRK